MLQKWDKSKSGQQDEKNDMNPLSLLPSPIQNRIKNAKKHSRPHGITTNLYYWLRERASASFHIICTLSAIPSERKLTEQGTFIDKGLFFSKD